MGLALRHICKLERAQFYSPAPRSRPRGREDVGLDLKNCGAVWPLERDMGDPGGTLASGELTGQDGVTGLGEDELLTRNIFRPCSSVGVPGL